MKNNKLLALLLVLVMMLSIVACNAPCTTHADADKDGKCDSCGAEVTPEEEPDDECTEHVDADENGKCDKCGTDVEAPECTEHVDTDENGKCDKCGTDVEAPECTEHVDADENGKCDKCGTDVEAPECTEHVDADGNGKCDKCDTGLPVPPSVLCETHIDADTNSVCDVCEEGYTCITIAEALELCGDVGNITDDRYYIRASVDSITNAQYGAMIISDETGSISVYGTYSYDGELYFPDIESTPKKGDTVVLHCILQNYNGTKEVKNARLVGYTDNSTTFDESKYTASTIAEARAAAKGELVIIEGVVARVTYSNGKKPAGAIIVDATGSIYVYDADLAGQVAIGNKVKVAAEKDYWILDTEVENANKFGYLGCNQLTDAYVLSNDKGAHDFDKTSIAAGTVMDILATPVTEDITTKIYKVTALVRKDQQPGFVNYYINDLDGTTGTYVYTQCNGSDFGWLDEFDGKICTVYLTALNAKSTATGCNWRFLPVAVEEIEDFKLADTDVPAHVLKYYVMNQFLTEYSGDPALQLKTSVSSELLSFEGATVTYVSSDESIITFTSGMMNAPGFGRATVTVTVSYKGYTAFKTIDITVSRPESFEYISVADAIAAAKDTEVTVKGIVGASLVNKTGFYLVDATGTIAVQLSSDVFKTISIGDEIILKGTRTANDNGTQIYINDGEVLANHYGNNDLPTDSYVTDKSLGEIFSTTDTTKVYVTTGVLEIVETPYYSNYYLQVPGDATNKMLIYSSNGAGLGWMDEFAGKEITLELTICNWNGKGNRIAVISVITEDGKIINPNNFDRYGA